MLVAIVTLTFLTAITIFSAKAMTERLNEFLTLKGAWKYREQVAHVAGKLESDPAAPAEIRQLATYLADHAFDRQEIIRLIDRVLAHPDHEGGNPHRLMKEQFGEKYAADLRTLLRAFAGIMKWESASLAVRLRQRRAFSVAQDEIKQWALDLWETLKSHNSAHGSWTDRRVFEKVS